MKYTLKCKECNSTDLDFDSYESEFRCNKCNHYFTKGDFSFNEPDRVARKEDIELNIVCRREGVEAFMDLFSRIDNSDLANLISKYDVNVDVKTVEKGVSDLWYELQSDFNIDR